MTRTKFLAASAIIFFLLGRGLTAYGVVVNQEVTCRTSALLNLILSEYPPEQRANLEGLINPNNFQDAYELNIVSASGWRTDIPLEKQKSYVAALLQFKKDETVIVGLYTVKYDPGSPNPAQPQGGYKSFDADLKFSLNFTASLKSGKQAAELNADIRDDKGKLVKVTGIEMSCVGLRN